MAKVTVRLPDDLKQKAQQMVHEQGVSLNGFINATLAAAIAQQETLSFSNDRLREADPQALHQRVLKFMRQSRPGEGAGRRGSGMRDA